MSPHKLKILVVDAVLSTQSLIKRYLERHGFDVICAGSQSSAQAVLDVHPIQFLLMDSSLIDSIDINFFKKFEQDDSLRIVVYTSKGKAPQPLLAVSSSVDKHIEEPFNLEALVTQVNGLLTSHPPAKQTTPNRYRYAFGDWYLNTQTQELTNKEHVPVSLSAAEYQLLVIFIIYPRIVLSREFLLQQTRARPSSPFDRTIDVRVGKLRKILGSGNQATPLFETVRRAGYVLNSQVEPCHDYDNVEH